VDRSKLAIPVVVVIALAALFSMNSLPQNEPSIVQRESQTEAEIHKLVNIQRVEHGLEPLIYDRELAAIAKSHSQDMYDRDYFEHDTPDGIEPEDRGKNAGYDCKISIPDEGIYYDGISENISMTESEYSLLLDNPKTLANDTVDGWMSSPLHRDLILDELFSVHGIGSKISENRLLITQNFC